MSRKGEYVPIVHGVPLQHRKIFTTGVLAKLLHAAPRTVSDWIDSGRMRGYRLPCSTDRRVLREDLIAFMIENKIPINVLEQRYPLLWIGVHEVPAIYQDIFPLHDSYEWGATTSLLLAGVRLEKTYHPVILLDSMMGRREMLDAAIAIRSLPFYKSSLIMAILGEDDSTSCYQFLDTGINTFLEKPVNPTHLATIIQTYRTEQTKICNGSKKRSTKRATAQSSANKAEQRNGREDNVT